MSGIDLRDADDFGSSDSAVLEPAPLIIWLIAGAEQGNVWQAGLEQHGIRLCAEADDECQLILVDERCADYSAQLARLPDRPGRPPLFFLVTNGAEPDCIRAFAAGADDYVHLPISPEALAARLKRVQVKLRDTSSMREQLNQSAQVAFQSMSINAELGRILHYMESSFACQEFAALAELTLQTLAELGLHSSLGIFHDRGLEYFYDDAIRRPIEQEVIENSRHLGRISDFGSRTILNYPHVGLLIRNMPLDDPLPYGILKDHICYIGNGLEARCRALITERHARERSLRIQTTAAVLQQMMAQMEQAKLDVTDRSTLELQGMLDALHHEFSRLCLTGKEEQTLMLLLTDASDRIHALFRHAAEQDQQFQRLLSGVAKTLER